MIPARPNNNADAADQKGFSDSLTAILRHPGALRQRVLLKSTSAVATLHRSRRVRLLLADLLWITSPTVSKGVRMVLVRVVTVLA